MHPQNHMKSNHETNNVKSYQYVNLMFNVYIRALSHLTYSFPFSHVAVITISLHDGPCSGLRHLA